MQITELRIRKVEANGKLVAYVTVTFDDCFVVHNVKIIEGRAGLFIAMPSRKTANGDYKDVAHPISAGFRQEMEDRIIEEYKAGHIEHGSIRFDSSRGDSEGFPDDSEGFPDDNEGFRIDSESFRADSERFRSDIEGLRSDSED